MINDDVYTRMKRENEQHALTILAVGSGKIKFKIGDAEKVDIVSIDEFEQFWLKERVYIKNISELKKVKAPAKATSTKTTSTKATPTKVTPTKQLDPRLDSARYVSPRLDDRLSLMDVLRAIQRVATVVFEHPDVQVNECEVGWAINASGHTEFITSHERINFVTSEITHAHLVLEVLDEDHVELFGYYGDGKTEAETKKLDFYNAVMFQLKRKVSIDCLDMQKTEAILEKILIPFFRNGEGGKKTVVDVRKCWCHRK